MSACGRVGHIAVRVWYSLRYYCQRVLEWGYYCQSVVQCAILLLIRGKLGDITIRVWYIGRYYC